MQNYTNYGPFNINTILPTDEASFIPQGKLTANGYKTYWEYLNITVPK